MDASAYLVRRKSNRHSPYAIIVVSGLHAIIIVLALSFNSKQKAYHLQSSLQMLELQDERPEVQSMLTPPKINFLPPAIHLTVPSVDFIELPSDALVIPAPYQLPYKNAEQYSDIFDPRLRKKLMEAQLLRLSHTTTKSKSWTGIDGRAYIELGDGLCNVSMPNTDTHSNAKNWGFTTCGKTDSEKAMDRVMADYESHKIRP